MNTKKKVKRKKKISTRKISKFQIKTFIFDTVTKTKKAEDIDEPVNLFLKNADVKDEDKITIDQGDGYVRVSIIHKVKIDKV